ncbi:MAG: protein translocase SEC61 complex subunit gamma [Candidatus Diapherotrites archaeon]|uniref:Protein translocase subunit SecE n=1 Tax=Candidatus Iainarchaeum sp. TaxID=3101447 RepID=A0A938YYS8_9ARCH|nr:protein translocase SEC61 complex subunit gamma [Candidatus Diapherotrites archaeon]
MQLNIGEKLGSFIASSRRVLLIARKPTWQEFQTMAKVTGIGILVIAVIGYIVYLVFSLAGLGA